MVFRVPHEFRDGELAYAREVNANFLAVTEQIRELNSNKADIELSNIASTGINNIQKASLTRTIGEYVFSSLPLNNSSLHLLDGSILMGNGVYKQFVEYIADLYDSNSNYFIDEEDWQTSVETHGVCAKFVYNSENNTVRLPKVTGIIEGTIDIEALGDLVEAGLPTHTHTKGSMNITGSTRLTGVEGISTSGAFSTGSSANGYNAGHGQSTKTNQFLFNAASSWTGSTSTADYSTSLTATNTVQPQTVKAFVYIVVATSQKTDLEVDIDNITVDLNNKADKDLNNINSSAEILISSLGMPSPSYTDLTLGATNTTYTAPANGFYYLYKGSTGNNQNASIANITTGGIMSFSHASWTGTPAVAYMFARKGDQIRVGYDAGGTSIFRFIYAKGSESEAS